MGSADGAGVEFGVGPGAVRRSEETVGAGAVAGGWTGVAAGTPAGALGWTGYWASWEEVCEGLF